LSDSVLNRKFFDIVIKMKILDLKKLMLLPLMCCVSIQQADAQTQEDKGAANYISSATTINDMIQAFKDLVRTYERAGANKKIKDRHGGLVDFPETLRVVHDLKISDQGLKTLNFPDNFQMGGIIASIPDKTKKTKPCVFKGAKTMFGMPNDNRPADNNPDQQGNLLAISYSSHTERQLINAVWQKRKNISGTHFIYTCQPPCVNRGSDRNGYISCCRYYAKMANAETGAHFYIFFRSPDINTLKANIYCDNAEKLLVLKKFVLNVLGVNFYQIRQFLNQLTNQQMVTLEHLDDNNPHLNIGGQNHLSPEDYDAIAEILFALLKNVNLYTVENYKFYENFARPGSPNYNKHVSTLYEDLIGLDVHRKNDLERIHCDVID